MCCDGGEGGGEKGGSYRRDRMTADVNASLFEVEGVRQHWTMNRCNFF